MAVSPLPPLDPKLDVVFKALFGAPHNADLLISLLNAFLDLTGDGAITSVEVLPTSLGLDLVDDKQVALDLLVVDGRGQQYGIEMQVRNHRAFPERIVFYGAKAFVAQLPRAAGYHTLRPLVLVVITDFVLFAATLPWRERFHLRGEASGQVWSTHLSVQLVELPKLRVALAEAGTEAEQWGVFLKEGMTMTTRADHSKWTHPLIRKGLEELERLGADPAQRALYVAREEQLRLQATELRSAYLDGEEHGREEGREEMARDLARRLVRRGDGVEQVADLTGLSVETVRALAEPSAP